MDLISATLENNTDERASGELVAAEVRKQYKNDEAGLLRDAMLMAGGEYAMVLAFMADLKISPTSRLSLVEKAVTAKDGGEMERALIVLNKSDKVPSREEPGTYKSDVSAHSVWLRRGDALPAEYIRYLFKQDADGALKLLGSGDESNPQVKILPELDELYFVHDPRAGTKAWKEKVLPVFADGLKFTNPYDAAYLAWFIGHSGLTTSQLDGQQELVVELAKFLPGYGGTLMRKEGATLQRTPDADAAKWRLFARRRIAAE